MRKPKAQQLPESRKSQTVSERSGIAGIEALSSLLNSMWHIKKDQTLRKEKFCESFTEHNLRRKKLIGNGEI